MAYAQVFVNEVYYGMYLITEETDKKFIQDQYEIFSLLRDLVSLLEPRERVELKGSPYGFIQGLNG
jgi:hypothetical protein